MSHTPIDNPNATKLGLCDSLVRVGVWEESVYGTVDLPAVSWCLATGIGHKTVFWL